MVTTPVLKRGQDALTRCGRERNLVSSAWKAGVRNRKNAHTFLLLVRTETLQEQIRPEIPVGSFTPRVPAGGQVGVSWRGGAAPHSHSGTSAGRGSATRTGSGDWRAARVGISQSRPASFTVTLCCFMAGVGTGTPRGAKGLESGVSCVHRKEGGRQSTCIAHHPFEAASPTLGNYPNKYSEKFTKTLEGRIASYP